VRGRRAGADARGALACPVRPKRRCTPVSGGEHAYLPTTFALRRRVEDEYLRARRKVALGAGDGHSLAVRCCTAARLLYVLHASLPPPAALHAAAGAYSPLLLCGAYVPTLGAGGRA